MNKISLAILLLILVLIAHLYEEVRTGFRQKFPLGEMPRPVFIAVNILLYAFCFSTLFLSANEHPLANPLAWVFALTMLINGIGHIGIMLYRKVYFPGRITAFVLLLSSIFLMYSLK
jgi:hypothetical protein